MKVLTIGSGSLSCKIVVWRQHRAQGIENVFARFLSRATLADCPRNLQDTRNDPALLVPRVKGIVKSTEAVMPKRKRIQRHPGRSSGVCPNPGSGIGSTKRNAPPAGGVCLRGSTSRLLDQAVSIGRGSV